MSRFSSAIADACSPVVACIFDPPAQPAVESGESELVQVTQGFAGEPVANPNVRAYTEPAAEREPPEAFYRATYSKPELIRLASDRQIPIAIRWTKEKIIAAIVAADAQIQA